MAHLSPWQSKSPTTCREGTTSDQRIPLSPLRKNPQNAGLFSGEASWPGGLRFTLAGISSGGQLQAKGHGLATPVGMGSPETALPRNTNRNRGALANSADRMPIPGPMLSQGPAFSSSLCSIHDVVCCALTVALLARSSTPWINKAVLFSCASVACAVFPA
jgi:hypothetical protein